MATLLHADTVHVALLADHGPTDGPGRVHAVLVWTERGERHYELLVAPVAAPLWPLVAAGGPVQLRFELGGVGHLASAGRTWRTWLLDSVPADLRHLPPAAAARALADRLTR